MKTSDHSLHLTVKSWAVMSDLQTQGRLDKFSLENTVFQEERATKLTSKVLQHESQIRLLHTGVHKGFHSEIQSFQQA